MDLELLLITHGSDVINMFLCQQRLLNAFITTEIARVLSSEYQLIRAYNSTVERVTARNT